MEFPYFLIFCILLLIAYFLGIRRLYRNFKNSENVVHTIFTGKMNRPGSFYAKQFSIQYAPLLLVIPFLFLNKYYLSLPLEITTLLILSSYWIYLGFVVYKRQVFMLYMVHEGNPAKRFGIGLMIFGIICFVSLAIWLYFF